jgi:hypothetical protein
LVYRDHVTRTAAALVLLASGAFAPQQALAGDLQTMVVLDSVIDEKVRNTLLTQAATLRNLVEPLPLPKAAAPLPTQRLTDVHRALQTARAAAEEANWAECVRVAGDGLAESSALLEELGDIRVLRDLHLQIGVCLVQASVDAGTADGLASARPHFEMATLALETELPTGLFRAEAEAALKAVREEVLKRPRGEVLVETDPPGASVWIDDREQVGVTPLRAEVRLGEHFITVRRFRFAPLTQAKFFQPSATLHIELDPPRRSELGVQLLQVGDGVPALERQLAEAAWSRADELLLANATGSGLALTLYDSGSGARLRELGTADLSAEGLKDALCRVFGEPCGPVEVEAGIPWYVWPLAGAALVGGIVTAAVLAETSRDVVLCPREGC